MEAVGDGKLSGDGVFAPDHVLGVAVLAERSSSRVTLRSTLEFGVAAYLRGIALLARLRVAQWWRREGIPGVWEGRGCECQCGRNRHDRSGRASGDANVE